MIRLVAILFLSLLHAVCLAPAAADPDDPFLAERLTREDARFLQAALSLSGHYAGLIDGAWGGRSAASLIAATGAQPTEGDVLQALLPLIEDEGSGWMALNSQGVSILAPTALLRREDEESDPFLSYATPTRDLILRLLFGGARDASDMHRWLAGNTVADAYTADTRAAYITKGRLAGGDTAYLWTRNLNGTYVSALVQWSPGQAGRARLMVASLSAGEISDLRLSPDGYLARMIDGLGARLTSDRPPQPAPAAPAPLA